MDTPLSPLGEQQARALGRWFAQMPAERQPTVVLCSPYVRARETARIVLEVAGIDRARVTCQADERLREKEFGLLDRLTKFGIKQKFPGARRAARARRQVLFPPARRRKLVRRHPEAAQHARHDHPRAPPRAPADRRPPGDRQLLPLPARAHGRGDDPRDRSCGRRAELLGHVLRVRSRRRAQRQAGAAPPQLHRAARGSGRADHRRAGRPGGAEIAERRRGDHEIALRSGSGDTLAGIVRGSPGTCDP